MFILFFVVCTILRLYPRIVLSLEQGLMILFSLSFVPAPLPPALNPGDANERHPDTAATKELLSKLALRCQSIVNTIAARLLHRLSVFFSIHCVALRNPEQGPHIQRGKSIIVTW